jgi:hypothetical protein
MLRFVGICAAAFVLALGPVPLLARIQDGSADVCWEPDLEWPVPCDDED